MTGERNRRALGKLEMKEEETQSPSEKRKKTSSEFIVGRLQKICVHGKLPDCS